MFLCSSGDFSRCAPYRLKSSLRFFVRTSTLSTNSHLAPAYNRSWLRGDRIAGLTVMPLLVPEGMAYTEWAGMPPQTAFYAASSICLAPYAISGSLRQLVVAVSSAIAVIGVLERYASQLQANGGKLMLAGVSEHVLEQVRSTETTEAIPEEDIFLALEILGGSTMKAMAAAERWQQERV